MYKPCGGQQHSKHKGLKQVYLGVKEVRQSVGEDVVRGTEVRIRPRGTL